MSVLNDLSDREKDIFLRRVGIKNGESETLDEIASCYGVTRERIRQVESIAMSKLGKHYANMNEKVRFMRIWQKADSVKLAAKAAGISYAYATQMSLKFRKEGIPLKKFPYGGIPIPKSITEAQRAAVDPKFKARKERNELFIKMWNEMTKTSDMAKQFSLGSRSAVNARAAQLRQAGYAVALRGSNVVMKVPAEEFVRAWQTASTVREVCEKTGMNYTAVQARRNALRAKGIPLKSFHRYDRLTPDFISDLKRIAKESLKEKYG